MRLERCDLANGFWRDTQIDRTEFIGCRLTGLDRADASLAALLGISVRDAQDDTPPA